MHYYIYDNDKLLEVSDEQYDSWMEQYAKDYKLPDYSTVIDGTFYGLETMYYGCIDKGEEVLPFVLLYFEDIATVGNDGINVNFDANKTDYFASFEELKNRYNELLTEIKTKEILQ